MAHDVLYLQIMDCYMALNNLLPRPHDEELNHDRAKLSGILLDAFEIVVEQSSFLNTGNDVFATKQVEFAGIIQSSYARVIVALCGQALERIIKLVNDHPVPFHKFSPSLSRGDISKLRRVKGHAITEAASGDNLTTEMLEKLVDRFNVEYEQLVERNRGAKIDQFSTPMLKGDVARLFGIKSDALMERIKRGELRVIDIKNRTIRLHLDDLPK